MQDIIFSQSLYNQLPEKYRDKLPNLSATDKKMVKNITLRNSNPMAFSYLPAGKKSVLSENGGSWARQNRQETGKVGKILKKVYDAFGIEISVDDLRAVVDQLKVNLGTDTFEIVEGDKLLKYYHGNNYAGSCGSLNASCMKHDDSQEYIKFYPLNDIKMLVSLRKGLVSGRALLWETDKGTVMDRIYGSDDKILEFIEHAKANDYWYKERQTYDDGVYFKKEGARKRKKFEIALKDVGESWPYCDSFKFMDKKNLTLQTYKDDKKPQLKKLVSTDGRFSNTGRMCFISEEYISSEDCVTIYWGDLEDEEVHIRYAVIDYEYNWIVRTEAMELEDGQFCLKTVAKQDYKGNWYGRNQLNKLSDGTWALRGESTAIYTGEWVLRERTVMMASGRRALKEECVIVVDGEWHLKTACKLVNDKWVLKQVEPVVPTRIKVDSWGTSVTVLNEGSYTISSETYDRNNTEEAPCPCGSCVRYREAREQEERRATRITYESITAQDSARYMQPTLSLDWGNGDIEVTSSSIDSRPEIRTDGWRASYETMLQQTRQRSQENI